MRAGTWATVLAWSALFVALAFMAIWFVYRPWQLRWGATDEEVARAMPGDEVVERPTFNATRAVTIRARPEEIWPWIIQIGYQRAGFYSHDWLDNDRIPSAQRILPEYQNLKVGDLIPMSKNSGARVSVLDPNRSMVLLFKDGEWTNGTWAWGLYAVDAEHTRLVTRLRVRLTRIVSRVLADMFEIVMMRKCMLGIKRRVELVSIQTAPERAPGRAP